MENGDLHLHGELCNRPRLAFSDLTIRRIARQMGPRQSVIVIGIRATVREYLMRRMRRINFRQTKNPAACEAYGAMQISEFLDINSRQAWANWRTIPRNLNGQLDDNPVFAIDLCSGTGDSTAVLAYYCAPGSRVLGYEMNPRFVEYARQRTYRNREGGLADVTFLQQDVLSAFHTDDGQVLPDRCVDLINASGAIGCHFEPDATHALAQECGRVLRSGGLALIDAGRGGADSPELADTFQAEGFAVVRKSRSCFVDQGEQLCLRKSHPQLAGSAQFQALLRK